MRKILISLLVLLAAPALPAAAGAHVEVKPVKAPAAKPVRFAFVVGHGCDGAATNRLTVRIPNGVTAIRPLPVPGWKARTSGRQVVWSGGPLDDHDQGRFPFVATLSGEKGDELALKVIQGCEGGAETAWIQVGGDAGGDDHDGHGSPAPVVTLTSTGDPLAAADDSGDPDAAADGPSEADVGGEATGMDQAETDPAADEDSDEGGGSPLRIVGLVLIVAAVTAWIVMRRNRAKS